MVDVPCFVGIDVAKAQLDIALRPAGERWAAAIGTIPWEIVCRIGARIQRVYQ